MHQAAMEEMPDDRIKRRRFGLGLALVAILYIVAVILFIIFY
jgi:hypothetical protein